MLDKVVRYPKAMYRLLKWVFIYRRRGFPVNRFNDPLFINWFKKYRKRLTYYENIHYGQDCFIIGNGPSLNNMDLEILNDYYVFGMNKIHLMFESQNLDLSYHVAVNPLVIDQIKTQLEEQVFDCPSFLPYNQSSKELNGHNNIEFILTGNAPWSFSTSILNPIHEGFTVTFVAMQIAFFMGFKRIFLIGVDHNFIQSGSPNEEQILTGPDINHFHPDYFSGKKWHLADLEASEVSYKIAKYFFEKSGRQILDATVNGKLKIFDKILFSDAISQAKKRN